MKFSCSIGFLFNRKQKRGRDLHTTSHHNYFLKFKSIIIKGLMSNKNCRVLVILSLMERSIYIVTGYPFSRFKAAVFVRLLGLKNFPIVVSFI